MNSYPTIDMAATGNRIRDLRMEHHMRVNDIVSFMGFESQRDGSWKNIPDSYTVQEIHEENIWEEEQELKRTCNWGKER